MQRERERETTKNREQLSFCPLFASNGALLMSNSTPISLWRYPKNHAFNTHSPPMWRFYFPFAPLVFVPYFQFPHFQRFHIYY